MHKNPSGVHTSEAGATIRLDSEEGRLVLTIERQIFTDNDLLEFGCWLIAEGAKRLAKRGS